MLYDMLKMKHLLLFEKYQKNNKLQLKQSNLFSMNPFDLEQFRGMKNGC